MDMEKMAALFETVKVLPLREKDHILFRCPTRIPFEQVKDIRGLLEKEFPGHRIIVIDGGCDIEIIRPTVNSLGEPMADV